MNLGNFLKFWQVAADEGCVDRFEVRSRPPVAEITEHPGYHEAVLGAIEEGLVVVRDELVVDVNERLCEMTGFARHQLVGAGMPWPFLPPEAEGRVDLLRERLEEHGRGQYELTLQRSDGERFAALVSAGAARAEAGELLGWVFLVRNISDRKRREARLSELAARDQLTGLLNKRSFHVNLAGEVARARRHGRKVCLALLDLDGFKRTNDEQGHQAGDRVLAEVAGRLGALSRSGEHLARIGGDEFGWILPETDAEGAKAAVIRARIAIASEPFRTAGRLTLSAGICESDGSVDALQMHARADRALYAAKAAGGDAVKVH
jgi:diguanylate cyclase (GGDEF)-like protein/PAS domain S-box-containing protein